MCCIYCCSSLAHSDHSVSLSLLSLCLSTLSDDSFEQLRVEPFSSPPELPDVMKPQDSGSTANEQAVQWRRAGNMEGGSGRIWGEGKVRVKLVKWCFGGWVLQTVTRRCRRCCELLSSAEKKSKKIQIPLFEMGWGVGTVSNSHIYPEIDARMLDQFTQDPSKVSDGIVTTLSVIHGTGKGWT